MQKMK